MPQLYSAEVGQQILGNYKEAEIPEVHKELFSCNSARVGLDSDALPVQCRHHAPARRVDQ